MKLKQLGIIIGLATVSAIAYADFNIYEFRPSTVYGGSGTWELQGLVTPHPRGGLISYYPDGRIHQDMRNGTGRPSIIRTQSRLCWRHGHYMPCIMCFGAEPAPTTELTVESDPDPVLLEQEQIARVASDIAAYDGPAAVQYLESLEPEKRELADLAVAMRWAYRDALAAAGWVETLPTDRRVVAAPGIVAMWAKQDLEAAGAWAASFPVESRDSAWATYCFALSSSSPATALEGLSQLKNTSIRVTAIEHILDAWMVRDEVAGHDWAVANRHLLTAEQIIRFLGEGSIECWW